MKIIDEIETEKKKQKKPKQTEKNKGVTQAIVKGWELIDFVVPVN